jgi:hypothetical protein
MNTDARIRLEGTTFVKDLDSLKIEKIYKDGSL